MRLCKFAKSDRFLRTVLVCAAFLMSAQTVHAASCANLKSELRRLESGAGSQSPAAQKWRNAQRQQQKAISAAERDARHFGCSSSSAGNCGSLNSKIKRMKANLGKIERQLAKAGGGSSKNTKRIRQVRAALAKCDAPAPVREAKAKRPENQEKQANFFTRLFNQKQTSAEQVAARSGDREIAAVRKRQSSSISRRRLPSGGTFRTVCVRTCDGYFFPVSFSTGKSQFVNDEARCSEICPAAPTELYVYRNPGGDQTKMMSLAGELYADQPFAYRYKSEFVEGCSCRQTRQTRSPSAWTELGSRSGNRIFLSDISAGLPRRSLQPSRGATFEEDGRAPSALSRRPLLHTQLPRYEDPDTRFNLEKGFDVTIRLEKAANRLSQDGQQMVSASLTENGLPLLSLRSSAEEQDAETMSPVFRTDDDGFRPASGDKSAVRVVGPEYFVAQ